MDTNDLGYQQALLYAEELRELYEKEQAQAAALRAEKEQAERILKVLERGLIKMVFQPIADLADGSVTGVEALARFAVEPSRTPDVWFEEAGAVNLREELELAAVRLALAHPELLPEGTYLSINLSPETVTSTRFAELLPDVPAKSVVLEVTEHARVDDYGAIGDALQDFRARGGRLAVDDAGAGFASLKHILRLAPEVVKLDREVAQGIDADRPRRALAAALISFAFDIGAEVVAEGIETQAEVDALRDLGVSYGQGYFLARPGPIPPDGFDQLLPDPDTSGEPSSAVGSSRVKRSA
ncbi:MAG TPA: EAL domain-containing protein [Actinomycetota bacterium]|nr:EAL domain-containing protein [Actinomycetota bacterium]